MNQTTKAVIDTLVFHLGGKCALCHKEYPDKRSWVIHHEEYKIGEKTYKDFQEKIPYIITRGKRKGTKTKKTVYHKLEYYCYLHPIVMSEPWRFKPLHFSCHQAVTRLARWQEENIIRLSELALVLRRNQDLMKIKTKSKTKKSTRKKANPIYPQKLVPFNTN